MAKINITDLNTNFAACFDIQEIKELNLEEIKVISGGISVEAGFQIGLGVTSAGIGTVAIATGPVGWLAGGILYGIGLGLSMYSGYLIGSAGSS